MLGRLFLFEGSRSSWRFAVIFSVEAFLWSRQSHLDVAFGLIIFYIVFPISTEPGDTTRFPFFFHDIRNLRSHSTTLQHDFSPTTTLARPLPSTFLQVHQISTSSCRIDDRSHSASFDASVSPPLKKNKKQKRIFGEALGTRI